jgi:pyrimidine-nucleoside phosphorylase
VNDLSKLPQPALIIPIVSTKAGYVAEIQAEEIGVTAMLLGAGRETKTSIIDHAVGVNVIAKVGHQVERGDVLAELLVNPIDDARLEEAKHRISEAFFIQSDPVPKSKLIYAIVNAEGVKFLN